MKIGVLDIQGSVEGHLESLRGLGKSIAMRPERTNGIKIEPVPVKTIEQLRQISGLIIPGGESTTIGKLLRRFGLGEEIIKLAKNGELAVWGTCAGAILLAKKIAGKEQADGLKLMNIVVERNAYGRQLDSFEAKMKFVAGGRTEVRRDNYMGEKKSGGRTRGRGQACVKKIPAVFIRAPKIISAGNGVKILARYQGKIVAARQKKLLVTTFHPELTDSLEVHGYFARMCMN